MSDPLQDWRHEPLDWNGSLMLVPIRHHSPACSRHLRALLEDVRPAAVLIESPSDAEPLIPQLLAEDAEPPLALYTTWIERQAGGANGGEPLHHASYWPLCEYSPEWVALRVAGAIGAEIGFIDLDYARLVQAGRRGDPQRAHSLQDEAHLQESRFLDALVRAAGVRDSNELWDHLFECRGDRDPRAFFDDVLAYCAASRHGSDPAALDADGTLAREREMAARIAAARRRHAGQPIVVVTGGYHTVALRDRAESDVDPGRPESGAGVTLMRYAYEQLDRLNGYGAGMPSPGFYERQWREEDVAHTITEFARELRAVRPEGASAAQTIAAVEQARGLQSLRGHARIGRRDLLDAIQSTFVKGSDDVEGVAVQAVARRLFAGTRRGRVPAGAATPPLVADFERLADRHRLSREGGVSKDLVLDGYRKASHREISRFLHRLELLDVPFARKVRGPDFARGVGLDRIQEVWNYVWQPATESALIEASRYGASLLEAATARMGERLREAREGDRRAEIAAELLVHAAACGLHDQLPRLLRAVEELVAEESRFDSAVAAGEKLRLVAQACEPLELHGVARPTGSPSSEAPSAEAPSSGSLSSEAVLAAAATAWERAALLLAEASGWPDDGVGQILDALADWRAAADDDFGGIGPFVSHAEDVLATVAHQSAGAAEVPGAALGLLHGSGAVDDGAVAVAVRGRLAGSAVDGSRFVRGLFHTDRSAVWQVAELIESLDDLLAQVEEGEFFRLCPHLRLAFSQLAPRELDAVGRRVAERAGRDWRPEGAVIEGAGIDADVALEVRAVDSRLRRQFEDDGLGHWLDGAEVTDG